MSDCYTIAFLLAPRFPLFGLASAVEVLRHANRFAGRTLYRWRLVCESGDQAEDSNGLSLSAQPPNAKFKPDAVFAVAGYECDPQRVPALVSWLSAQRRRSIPIGGISNGAFLLGHAGLLEGRAATVHFEDFGAFHASFPRVHARYQRTVIDANRLSCSGGTSTLDLFIEWLRREHGQALASQVSQQMLIQATSLSVEHDDPHEFEASHRYSAPVQRALDRLEATHQEGLSVNELAEHVGLNRRELLRQFRRDIDMTPSQALRQRRLLRARSLIKHSDLPLISIASAVGFCSQSHMTAHYRRHFGHTPAQARKLD
ncbi:MAG: helix-turn-helix domain-containing protein [Pseudomonadota bacterium]